MQLSHLMIIAKTIYTNNIIYNTQGNYVYEILILTNIICWPSAEVFT